MSSTDYRDFYEASSGNSDLNANMWYSSYSKKHAYKVYSDHGAVDEYSPKISPPLVDNNQIIVNTFSDKINNIFKNTYISVENEIESVKLQLDDRVITMIIDESGSMTWNDNDGFRHSLASEIINKVEQNYPGQMKYNLLKYGASFVNVILFGLIEEEGVDVRDITSFSSLYFSDTTANYAGIRVIRNEDHYPLNPLDGESVFDGFMSKIFEDELSENQKYYYTIYTYDKNYKFSSGVNISVTPKEKHIPRGVTVFRTFPRASTLEQGESLVGTGVRRDNNTSGIWHFNEGSGDFLYDFTNSKANLLFNDTPQWLRSDIVPAGLSGIHFNGISTYASYTDDASEYNNDKKFDFSTSSKTEMTFMGWIYPYSFNTTMSILSYYTNTTCLYDFSIQSDGKLYVTFNGYSLSTTASLSSNVWTHISVSIDFSLSSNNVIIYINGVPQTLSSSISLSTESITPSTLYVGSKQSSNYFYGRMTELSLHNIIRSEEYILSQIQTQNIYNDDGDIVTNNIGENQFFYTGLKEDNFDRLNVFNFIVPEDANFLGGEVVIIRKDDNSPSWEEDYSRIVETISPITAGEYYITDADNFSTGETYYYRIYSKNIYGNYSYSSDSPSISIIIPPVSATASLPEQIVAITPPTTTSDGIISISGNRKVYLKWNSNASLDENISRTKIYYSYSDYPVIGESGGSPAQLLFTSLPSNEKFVHFDIAENEKIIYYSIVNVDKYGRTSNPLNTYSTPSATSNEDLIPLKDVENISYEIYNKNAVAISWKQPKKNPTTINAYFDQNILIFASIADEFGNPLPDNSLSDVKITATITRENPVDDVFGNGETVSFSDEDAYKFSVSGLKDGIIKGSLRMTTDPDIISQISKASFVFNVKSIIPNRSATTSTLSESSGNSTIDKYTNTINDLLNELDGGVSQINDTNVFEYTSQSITVNFTNPWEIELYRKYDYQTVMQKCFYTERNAIAQKNILRKTYYGFDGIYVGATNPFVARAKLKYKGEAVQTGNIDIAIWDARADLCSCAGSKNSKCSVPFYKTIQSVTVDSPAASLPVLTATEVVSTPSGEVSTLISYADIPIQAPSLPQKAILYVKGSNAGFSTLKSLNIVFQSPLSIEMQTRVPAIDGTDIAEQIATVKIINPDNPQLTTPVPDNTVVQWNIIQKAGDIQRFLYSTDNTSIPNGIFSYTRNGVAKRVFLGPIQANNQKLEEEHEINSTVVYNGLSDIDKQTINIDYNPTTSPVFGARFLMEMEYGYKDLIGNTNAKLWADGEHFVKLRICRDPNYATDFDCGDIFRRCADEESKPKLELSPSGQIINLTATDENIEFVWGEVNEVTDTYTGITSLEIDDPDTGYTSTGSAEILLNEESVSDTTIVYIRINEFCPDAFKSLYSNPEECNHEQINLSCLKLTDCDLPGGNAFISGTTNLAISNKMIEIRGGGGMEDGVPPCPILFVEPLQMSVEWTKVDGIEVNSFTDDDGITILDYTSIIDIRVKVSFAGLPVPEGTYVYAKIGQHSGFTIFIPDKNIVAIEISETDGHSYADIRFYPIRLPSSRISETATISCTYDKLGEVEREVSVSFLFTLEHEDITEESSSSSSISSSSSTTITVPSVYSKTMERYSVTGNDWGYVRNMSEARGDSFCGVVNNKIYIIGGLKNTSSISNTNESYNPLLDSWSFKTNMPTRRYGGHSFTFGNYIYAIGGIWVDSMTNSLSVSDAVERYDTVNDSWETMTPMPIAGDSVTNYKKYGVAFGTGQLIQISGKHYFYICSGVTQIYEGDSLSISEYNNRVLRYCVDDDIWEYSRTLYSNESIIYQRISPCSLIDGYNMIVFNGATGTYGAFDFPTESFSIDLTDLSSISVIGGGDSFGKLPESKYQSSCVKYIGLSGTESKYYVMGGILPDSSGTDIVEKITTSDSPFSYENSYSTLKQMPVAKSGCSIVADYVTGPGFIYVIGGYTNGMSPGYVNILFDI